MSRRVRVTFGLAGVALVVGAAYFGTDDFDPRVYDPGAGSPLVITDRHGRVLRSLPSESGRPGRDAWVPLSDVSSHVLLTILASEDQRFYEHDGVDVEALARAAWLTLTTDGRFGGSTITMQLAKMTRSAGEPRSITRKLVEMREALGIERHLDKGEILEQYVNRAYFGHGAYGIEAASRRYFGKPSRTLSVGEATLLAVLPRGPSTYDPIAQLPRALARRQHLMMLLVRQGRLSAAEAQRALEQRVSPQLHASSRAFEAPHFVDWVISELPADLRREGGTVVTTLDLGLQRALEHRTRDHVDGQRALGVEQAGVVVLDAETADVLAMVGSTDYAAEQINIVTRRRHPGSSLKPFVYATAIEAGRSPSSIAYDVSDISATYRDPGPERGPISYREALAGSLNFAAVHVIEQIGIEPVMERLERAGVAELRQNASDYGSRLALGSAKVRLLDLAAGYRFLVRQGRVRAPTGIVEVRRQGHVVHRPPSDERRAFSEETSWLVMDMLSDPDARRSVFGYELPVDLPYRVVAKTGTAEGFSDTVAVLATNDVIVASWAGRFDGGATQGRFGMAAAAPLARAGLLLATSARPQTLPTRPREVVRHETCALSGLAPGARCHHRRVDWFRAGTEPAEPCTWHSGAEARYPAELQGWARRARRVALR